MLVNSMKMSRLMQKKVSLIEATQTQRLPAMVQARSLNKR